MGKQIKVVELFAGVGGFVPTDFLISLFGKK